MLEAYIAQISYLVLSAVISFGILYLYKLAKDNEKYTLYVSLLDNRFKSALISVEKLLKDKIKDNDLSKEEISQLKVEAIEILKKEAKLFGIEIAPQMFPNLVDLIFKNILK